MVSPECFVVFPLVTGFKFGFYVVLWKHPEFTAGIFRKQSGFRDR